MTDFQTPVDIGNRALQHIGAKRIVAFTDQSKNAAAISFCYDKLRKAELRRNVWRFDIRRAVLRPTDTTSMTFIPGAFDNAKTYLNGSIVSSGGLYYQAQQPISAAGGTPDTNVPAWLLYFGPKTVQPYDVTGTTGYYSGELVYDTTGHVYLSLVSNNSAVPTAGPPAWDATVIYNKGQTVTQTAVVYQSTQDLNLNNTPTGTGAWVTIPVSQPDSPVGTSWLKLGAASVTSIQIIYPLGSGPSTQSATRNVFYLPNGFLREAPQDPKAGSVSFLGAPSGLGYDDWEMENQVFVSREAFPIVFRFGADLAAVPLMDTMFCEGLACRIAAEVCEELTQSVEKIQTVASAYKTFMGEARTVNGIETGATEPPEDDYITCRI